MTWKNEGSKQRVRRAGLVCVLIMLTLGLALPMLCTVEASESEQKVCLFLDDGWQNQYDVAFPILKTYGFKASFAVVTDSIGVDRGTFAGRMNVEELKELQACGMDIACHTKTHPHMLNLTSSQLYNEVVDSKNNLMQMGFSVKTFVYSFGEWNDTIAEYVSDAGYLCAREARPAVYRLNDPDPKARYHICSWQITNQSLDAFKQVLSHATEDEVVVLTYHFISDKSPKETYITTQNFHEQMSYLRENNFMIVLLPELFVVDEEPSWLLPYFAVATIAVGLTIVSVSCYLRLCKSRKLVSHSEDKGSHRLVSVFEKRKQHSVYD